MTYFWNLANVSLGGIWTDLSAPKWIKYLVIVYCISLEVLGLLAAWLLTEGPPFGPLDFVLCALRALMQNPQDHLSILLLLKMRPAPIGSKIQAVARESCDTHTHNTLFSRGGWQSNIQNTTLCSRCQQFNTGLMRCIECGIRSRYLESITATTPAHQCSQCNPRQSVH